MAKRYNQGVSVASARFTQAPMGEIEFSKLYGEPSLSTTMNAGDIVPVYCSEVLPHSTFSIGVEEVIRQATLSVPVMDRACIDIFAYFVPNRVVNKSWKSVMGENANGSWTASKVSLAPLSESYNGSITIPVGSVADYYGYPTQGPLSSTLLQSMHDLKFRGYLEIYNNYFRDQNYQPPIPYSKLNVYNGFLLPPDSYASYGVNNSNLTIPQGEILGDNTYGIGSIVNSIAGGDASFFSSGSIPRRKTSWTALSKPLKANKLHDYFTSVLPSPQKGEEVVLALGETAPVIIDTSDDVSSFPSGIELRLEADSAISNNNGYAFFGVSGSFGPSADVPLSLYRNSSTVANTKVADIVGSNLNAYADLSSATGVSISDLRMSSAIQQVYEIMGRGGTRYTEYINSFFGLDIDNPFSDIPTCLGHIRRNLDLYQTAQTSATTEESPQGSLSAFGYTSTGGDLFTRTFLEHGYIHIFAVIRHRNIYPAFLSRDNFRLEQMDFYQYPLANISEQPVYTREINPFYTDPEQVFGYQEAWSEYRMEPDRVSGYMRTGISGSLAQWNYADDFSSDLAISDGDWLQSNTDEVMRRSTAIADQALPQFKAKFTFKIHKQLPMPTYSMSGLDIF